MANSKATKKALFMSIMSLLLCFTMLMGATFAWFTDTVTSANNRIQAGNLEIDLLMDKGENGNYETIADGEGDIFSEETGNGINWEPGKTEIVYLAVRNNGSLAIRYNILLDIVSEASAADKKPLAEALEYAIIDGAKAADVKALASNWETVKANATATGDLPTGQLVAAQGGILDEIVNGTAEETQYFALAIHMKEEAGNEYQNESVEIDVTVLATQKDAEEDSFGPDYDANAGESVDSPEALAAAIAQGGTYKLASDMTLDSALTIPEGTTLTLNLNGKSINNDGGYAIENKGDLTINGNGDIAGLGGIRSTAGTVTINGGEYNGSSRWQDGTYQHTLKAENTTVVINGGTFDATINGQTNAMFNVANGSTMTINSGTFKNVEALGQFDPYLFTYEGDGTLIINDGTFLGGWRFNGDAAKTTINGGNFTVSYDGQSFNTNSTHVLSVSGGQFTKNTAYPTHSLADKVGSFVADGSVAIDNGDGTVTVQDGITVTAANWATITPESNSKYYLSGDFENSNVSLVMAKGVENVLFDGSNATNINELIITQNGALIDNATTAVGDRSGKVTIQNFKVLSQINVFACKTEVEVAYNTAEALMVYAGNCAINVHNNSIDANFESHPTYKDATNTWNTNKYGIALNIFDYDLRLDDNTVTDALGHAIGINGWETTIDTGNENEIKSFTGNIITVNSTSSTKRAAFKVWDDETYASNDEDTNVVNATAQAFIDAVLADGSNTFNILEGYDHTIFCFYNVNTNN